MPENVATQNSPKISWEGLFLPCNQLLSLDVYPTGTWVDACTRKELSISRMEAALSREALLNDFMVRCMGQTHQ